MKNWLKHFVGSFIKPSIVFESTPAFSDNTKPVYDELLSRGYAKKYCFIWYINDDKCASIKNGKISYWNPRERDSIYKKIRNYSLYYKTKCLICCNTFLPAKGEERITFGPEQVSFYLTHGIPMKSVKGYYTSRGGVDFMLSPAKAVNEIMAYEFSFPEDSVFALGYPRVDVFSKHPICLNQRLSTNYNKVIIWYPTYRQNKNGSIKFSGNSMPLIHDEKNAILLNEAAKFNNILIILKPHFVQDISLIQKLDLSNIWLIDDSFFEKHGFSSYEMLAASDALLTDYSSVYFDYTLRDKPIGVIWEDIEEYKVDPGFALDLDYYLKGAEKIYTIDELCQFVEEVAKGEDKLCNERREIRDTVSFSLDGKNTERVVDFIIEKAKL